MAEKLETGVWKKADTNDASPYWNVHYVSDITYKEARKQLSEVQYQHIKSQIVELSHYRNPRECPTVWTEPIGTIYELKDKGGILGNKNVRVFWFTDGRDLIILGVHKKEDDRQLRPSVLKKYERRRRLVLKARRTQKE